MMLKKILYLLPAVLFTLQCFAQHELEVTVTNTLDFDRTEVVAVTKKQLSAFLKDKKEATIVVRNTATGQRERTQWIDYGQDGNADELLFMATVKAKSTARYTIEDAALLPLEKGIATPEAAVAFSRFVPERTDDYAWENDRVAFRTYGPDAQRRAEQKLPNGTLSSGIDLWLKSTPLPIIDKWYKGYMADPNYYHKDRGEGYDPYHVGGSRGTGGTGIWINDSLLVSKNFTGYTTIATGPLRTVFELTYAPYSTYTVTETKRISLDLGTNFAKFEVRYSSRKPLPNYAIGITLHENKGQALLLASDGVFAYNETIDGLYLGEGLVFDPHVVQKAFANKSKTNDQSNLLVLVEPKGTVTYYAGFAWEKGGQAKNAAEWETLLKQQAEIAAHALLVTVQKP